MKMMRGFPWTPEKGEPFTGQNGGRQQDPADMGTAFGLEAILADEAQQVGYDPQRAAGAEGRAASDLPHGMEDRLNRRSVI
jgi:hypothetical protein